MLMCMRAHCCVSELWCGDDDGLSGCFDAYK